MWYLMRSTAKRLVRLCVMLSLIVISMIVIVDDGSSADGIDCKKYYYNQLKYDFEKEIYDKIEKIKDFEVDKDSGSTYVTFDVKVNG